jgi:hypothetical protein
VGATVFFSNVNELATLRNVFKVNGTPTDPTTISLIITDPTQASTTYTFGAAQITRNGTGDYQKDIASSIEGDWTYEWIGTGTASDDTAGTWHVFGTSLGKLYASVETLKSRLGSTTTVDEFEFHQACFAASRGLEWYCERHFWRTATGTARTFVPHDYYCLKLPEFNDLVSVATLKTDAAGDGTFETTWAASDYQLLPQNPSAAPEQQPYTEIRAVGTQTFPQPYTTPARMDRVEITGVFGWPAVPYGIQQAALILAAKTFKIKDAPFGVAGVGDFVTRVRREDPMFAFYADPYSRVPRDDKGNTLRVA